MMTKSVIASMSLQELQEATIQYAAKQLGVLPDVLLVEEDGKRLMRIETKTTGSIDCAFFCKKLGKKVEGEDNG